MDMEVEDGNGRNDDSSREGLNPVSDYTRDDRETDLVQVARCLLLEREEDNSRSNDYEEEEEEDDDNDQETAVAVRATRGGEGRGSENPSSGSSRSGSPVCFVTYRDTATWTAEDGMPSPIETSPVSSPHSTFLFPSELVEQLVPPVPPHHNTGNNSGGSGASNQSSKQHNNHGQSCYSHNNHSNNSSSGYSNSHSHQGRHSSGSSHHHHHHHHQNHRHRRQQKIINPQQLSECFTVSSQLMSREARLYENVPTSQSELENLGLLLSEIHPHHNNNSSSGSGQLLHSHSSNNSNETASTSGNNSGKNSSNLNNELLSVTDLLGVVGPPSRASWADSGRESLSFDGENNNSNGSSKNLLLYPPPPPLPMSVGGHFGNSISGSVNMHHHHNCPSPLHGSYNSGNPGGTGGGGKKPRRERLVRQKQAIEETFHPIDKMGTNTTSGVGGLNQYLAVPSPRRGVIPGGLIASNLVNAAASPINLQRHPDQAQLSLHENKKSHPLIPCESPYILTSTNEWTHRGGKMMRNKSPQRMGGSILGSVSGSGASSGACGVGSSGGGGGGGLSFAASKLMKGSSGKYHQSFDYGELPSHQMFPKRHLLAQGARHFSHQLSSAHTNNGSNSNLGMDNPNNSSSTALQQCSGSCVGAGGGGGAPPGAGNLLAPHQHRSFPAGLFSGVAPRSCSMGDLTSCNSTAGGPHCKSPDPVPIASATTGGIPSNIPLVTSLPLPPATSVTYEFSLAPVSGTLAPGWHLTAVQRGLATAVPLAAVVARRRLPRPRPSARQRFGFTDKNEARRAKWTIVITALALLAMSMLLVGVTLRLAPLIDDLVRKENEHLLKVIQQTSVNVTSSTAATLLQTDANISQSSNTNNNIGNSDSSVNGHSPGGGGGGGHQSLSRTTEVIADLQDDSNSEKSQGEAEDESGPEDGGGDGVGGGGEPGKTTMGLNSGDKSKLLVRTGNRELFGEHGEEDP